MTRKKNQMVQQIDNTWQVQIFTLPLMICVLILSCLKFVNCLIISLLPTSQYCWDHWYFCYFGFIKSRKHSLVSKYCLHDGMNVEILYVNRKTIFSTLHNKTLPVSYNQWGIPISSLPVPTSFLQVFFIEQIFLRHCNMDATWHFF